MSLADRLAARLGDRVTVVGIGNPLRGDDAAGILAASLVRPGPQVRVVDAEDVPESFLGPITADDPDTVVLVDSVDLGAAPGAVAVVETDELASRCAVTHRTSLTLLADVVRRQTAADVFVLAIQPADTRFGAPANADVVAAARGLGATLDKVLDRHRVESAKRPRRGHRGAAPW
jgi:hydrogenase maturation protease